MNPIKFGTRVRRLGHGHVLVKLVPSTRPSTTPYLNHSTHPHAPIQLRVISGAWPAVQGAKAGSRMKFLLKPEGLHVLIPSSVLATVFPGIPGAETF